MSKCKDERMGIGADPGKPSLKIPLSSIKSVLQIIKCAFQMPNTPLPFISAREIEIGMKFRPGISKTDTVARILSKKSSAGINAGPNNDGSENKSNKKDKIVTEEIMDELMYKAKVEVVIPSGNLIVSTTNPNQWAGSFQAGPYPVVGALTNIAPIKAEGMIR